MSFIMRHSIIAVLFLAGTAQAADPFHKVADDVNPKLVKLFGAGGFRGIANYGTGILISPDGHILTSATQMLDSAELVVHLSDGVKMKATVLVVEPLLDAITNNPGAAGGALVNLKGQLIGVVGKEIKNSLSETWMNYAIPLTASVEVKEGDKTTTITLPQFVALGMKGLYKPIKRPVVE